VFAASLLVPLLLLALITGICAGVARRVVRNPVRRRELDTWYAAVRWPAIAAMTLVTQGTFIPALGFPVTFRIVYARIAVLLFVVAAAWLMRRLLTLGFARARSMTWGKDAASTRSLRACPLDDLGQGCCEHEIADGARRTPSQGPRLGRGHHRDPPDSRRRIEARARRVRYRRCRARARRAKNRRESTRRRVHAERSRHCRRRLVQYLE